MRIKSLATIISSLLLLTASAKADFNGSTFTLSSPFVSYTVGANVTISNVVSTSVNYSILTISNASSSAISVNWAAGGHAVGLETTNQISLPAAKIVQITVNAALPGILTYSTQLEHAMPQLTSGTILSTNDIVPELLYYRLTEGFGPTNPPTYIADSSLHGGTTGTVSSCCGIPWVTNVASMPQSAIHFNGVNTMIDTGNNSLFNFTNNLFTVNIWVRPLIISTQPVAIGNGTYLASGWYVFLSPVGAAGIAANSPNSSTYVATSSPCTSPGTWTMLTFVRTSTTSVSIYANGVLQNTVGSFMDPSSCSDNLWLGSYHPYSLILDGDIGVTRIYNRALSVNEITKLYNNSISGLVP